MSEVQELRNGISGGREVWPEDERGTEKMLPEQGDRLLYRVSEAAEMLGIGRTVVYELMNEGRITSVRIGHRRLIPKSVLDDFVAGLLAEAS